MTISQGPAALAGPPAPEEGFALAEVLVAFAILALVTIGLLRAFAGTTATLQAAAGSGARLELAERILAERRAEPNLAAGRREGEENGLAWSSTVSPLPEEDEDAGAPDAARPFRLLRLAVFVGRPGDAPAAPLLTTLVLSAASGG